MMNIFKNLLIAAALLFSGQALALSTDHPANPEATTSSYRPADYFSDEPLRVAANEEHQHDAAPANEESAGKGCKREEGKGCCCCKCCDKSEGKEGSGCMRKSGEHDHDHGPDGGKSGCGKMMKGMDGKMEEKAETGDAHEGHH
jgi:hypothetical protein